MHISATDLKNKLGEYLEASIREPVIVEKSGRPSAVVISYQEFKRLLELEDKIWAMRALEAEKHGYLGPEATKKFLQDLEKRINDADKET